MEKSSTYCVPSRAVNPRILKDNCLMGDILYNTLMSEWNTKQSSTYNNCSTKQSSTYTTAKLTCKQ